MLQFYVGVVEDRFDPMELGRCRVRVFGVHTDDKNDLPTSDLPWAHAMTPIVSASNSGIGMSPTGIVHGSWVIGFFLDGEDKQQFMMMGTLTAIQAQAMISSGSVAGTTTPTTTTVTPTTDQTPITNTVSGTVDPTTVRQPTGWTLGQTSKQYESGSRGCGAINNYHNSGDLGGASYGSYQFASYLPATMPNGKGRPNSSKSPVKKYLAVSSYGSRFSGLEPATSAFDQAWTTCASSDPTGFQADQHAYVKATYYDVMIGNLKRAGLDLTPFGAGVQDLVWSTAVQMGPARTSVFLTPLKGVTKLDDVTIINAVMDYKIANVSTLFSRSSDNIKANVRSRYVSEKKALLALASQYNSAAQIASTQAEKDAVIPPKPVTPIPSNPLIPNSVSQLFSSNAPVYTPYTPTNDPANKALIANTATGFSDPDGVYPTSDYANEPDTNKLARGVYAGTPAEDKSLNRATGIPITNGDTFDQPINPFNAKYPYNKVLQTEAGHVVEYDDTPGSERINIYHTSGTFTEIDAIGNMTRRVVGSDYQITDGNGYVRVEGRCNISVGGSANVYVSADANIEVDGDVSVQAGNDIDVYAAGRVTVSGGEALDFRGTDVYISADNDFMVTAGGRFNVEAGGAMNLKAGTGMYHEAATEMNIVGGSGVNVQAQSGDIDLKSDGNINSQSGSDTNVFAGGSAKVYGTSSSHLRSAGMTAIDGSSMQIQNGSSVEAGVAGSAQVAEDALYGEAGLDDTRTEYDEYLIDDEFPTNRVDRVVLSVETPEEAANGGTATIQSQLVNEGVATTAELNSTPVAQTAPETNYSLPTTSKPFTVGKTDAQQMAYIKTLTNIPANFKLTPNFTLGALSINAPAQHDRLVAQCNLTEGEIAANLYALAVNVLEPIKAKYPNMFVTSSFRNFAHNTLSKSASQHCLGLAADMQFTGVSKSDYFKMAGELRSLLPAYDQLLLEYKTTGSGNPWIHISFNSAGNRGQVLTMFNNRVHNTGLVQLA